MTFLLRRAQKLKFWDFGWESDLHLLNFVLFNFCFFAFAFSPFFHNLFFFCCSDWPSTGLASCSKTTEKAPSRQAIFAVEEAHEMAGNLFTQVTCTEHFRTYSRLNWADHSHSDLGINGKIFSSCKRWLRWIMPILINDDVRSRTKTNTRQG